jgi:O-antigen/teichoic acid export membrane protein
MGKVTRQGISSSIFIYIGMVLGFINATILFPRLLGKEVYGFCQFMLQIGELLAVFTLLGLPNVTIRFFPRFRDPDTNHNGILGFALSALAVSTLIGAGILFAIKPQFIEWFADEESRNYLPRFYSGFVLLFVFANFNALFNSYATALQRPRVPTFFSEVGSRIITLLLILFFFLQWIDEDTFIWLFTFKMVPITLGLILFLYLIGEWRVRTDFSIIKQPIFKEVRSYGIYAIFARIGSQLINRIDMIMIKALLTWGDVGVYTVFFFISQVIIKPHDGIGKMANPMMAEYWQRNNLQELESFYKRTALNNWVPAVLLFAGIVANLENAVLLIGEDYRAGTNVAVFLGVAQLVHVLNGYNGIMLIHSPFYRFDLMFKLSTVVITIISNYFFISWIGLTGAAVATALTIILQNLIIQAFLYQKLRIHPFSRPMITVGIIGLLSLAIGLVLPRIEWHFVADTIVRSGLMSITFVGLVLFLNPAPDITAYFWKLVRKTGLGR